MIMASIDGTINANDDESAILDRRFTAKNEERVARSQAPYGNRDAWFAHEYANPALMMIINAGMREQEHRKAIEEKLPKATPEQVDAIMQILHPPTE